MFGGVLGNVQEDFPAGEHSAPRMIECAVQLVCGNALEGSRKTAADIVPPLVHDRRLSDRPEFRVPISR